MSDPLERVNLLAAQARLEQTPLHRPVAAKVLQRIRDRNARPSYSLAVFAALSAVASVAVLLLGLWFVQTAGDPLASYFEMATVLSPWQLS